MDKKRLLVLISFSFSIRYIYRSGLLHRLRQFCTPVVAITWNQADLVDEMRNDGFEVHVIPESRWDAPYETIRAQIDAWFYNYQSTSPSRKIQNRYLRGFLPFHKRVKKSLREKYNRFLLGLPGKKASLFEAEKNGYTTQTNYTEMVQLVNRLDLSAVFTVTPFHRQEDVLLRACKNAGKRMITSILSFDNVTKRGWLPVEYDAYMVWNRNNEKELRSIYPDVARQAAITIVGAAQFDFYFDPKYLPAKQDWQQQVGIDDPTRKIILYAGGPRQLLPQEPLFLKDINEAIGSGAITGNPLVLFRCHPMDNIERWKKAIGPSANIIYETSWTGTDRLQNANLTHNDIVKLCANLAFTDVHINACSTMTVDGSAYGKPQIGPAYDNNKRHIGRLLRTMYRQDHFLPIVRAGLFMAHSKNELVTMINEALIHPEKYAASGKKILEEIITYTDGQCTSRVAAILEKELELA